MLINKAPNSGSFTSSTPSDHEITPPERIVFTEIYDPFPDVESVVTSVFTEEAGKTRLTVTAKYPSQDVRDMVIKTGMEKGAGISYDRLEELVLELQGGAPIAAYAS